jgi:DNA-damage-inducible protein J
MANVNVRIDATTKADAEAIFSELGLTPSTAINLFYKQVIRTGSIPFTIKIAKPNRKTVKALKEVEKMEKGLKKAKDFKTVEELMEDLEN